MLERAHYLVSVCGSSGKKGNMQVETTRSLNGTLKDLLNTYGQGRAYVIHDPIKKAMMGEPSTTQFRIQAADTGYEILFNNREVLSRFASLHMEYQKEFLQCIRKAMEKEQVIEIQVEAEWGAASKRTIKIRQTTSGVNIGYGQGPLSFF